jgi:hypothetical protein
MSNENYLAIGLASLPTKDLFLTLLKDSLLTLLTARFLLR